MHSNSFEHLQRILAIRLDNIGDVVMLGPALRALRQAYPQAEITLMASKAGTQAAALLPWVDEVITWRAIWQEIGKDLPTEPGKEHELFSLLQAKSFDAAFIFTSFSQSPFPPAYACYMAGIPLRVGQSREFGGGLLSHWVKPLPDEIHQVERSLHLLRSVGIPADNKKLELRVPLAGQRRADTLLDEVGLPKGQPFIALAAGASAVARRYDEKRFARAARMLIEQTGLPVVLIGSPRELGQFPNLEALAEQDERVLSLIGKTSVVEMAGVIRRSALVIANNSGSMHIADAFHRPMVILFSGTDNIEQWVPRTPDARLLNRSTECAPCRAFQCPYGMECLDIPAEEIVSTALSLLKAKSSNHLASPLVSSARR